jgi:hypothetical protein
MSLVIPPHGSYELEPFRAAALYVCGQRGINPHATEFDNTINIYIENWQRVAALLLQQKLLIDAMRQFDLI